MNRTIDIYRDRLPKLANDFIYYAQCNPNKYKVITRVEYGVVVKVYKRPFNTLVFEYYTQDNGLTEPCKTLRFANNNHEYQLGTSEKDTDYSVFNENSAEVLKQVLVGNEYLEDINFYHEDFERVYDYFLKDQGYYENKNSLF